MIEEIGEYLRNSNFQSAPDFTVPFFLKAESTCLGHDKFDKLLMKFHS